MKMGNGKLNSFINRGGKSQGVTDILQSTKILDSLVLSGRDLIAEPRSQHLQDEQPCNGEVRVAWGTARLRVNKQHDNHPHKAIHQVQINTPLVLWRHYLSNDLNSGHSPKSFSMQISFWAVKIWVRKCMTSLDTFYLSQFWIIYRLWLLFLRDTGRHRGVLSRR